MDLSLVLMYGREGKDVYLMNKAGTKSIPLTSQSSTKRQRTELHLRLNFLRNKALTILGIIGVLILWETAVRLTDTPIIPSLFEIGKSALFLIGTSTFWINILSSMQMLIIGYIIAFLIAFGLSIAIYNIKGLNALFVPFLTSVRNVATVSIIPILIVLFGIEKAKIVGIIWTAWPAIFVNALIGYHGVEKDLIEAANLDGANKWETFWLIVLPLSKRVFVGGMALGATGAWITLVTAETIGSTKGIGYSILTKTQVFKYSEAFVYIFVVAIVSYFTMNFIKSFGEKDE